MPLEEFLAGLSSFNFSRIYFNSVVSFTKQLLLVQTLTSLRLDKNIPITFYLHDYHSICPSHFLINSSGAYCGVPERGTCRGCLPNVREGLATLFVEKDIDLWRRHWLNLLAASDEIICFSEASKSLLLRAYPALPAHQPVVRPHDIEDFPTRQVAFDSNAALHLGVVGHISVHKGASIVQEVARLMDLRNAGERLTVFGALDGRQAAKCLTVTGKYDRNSLAELISQHGVNMLAFTSIVPETFSFVISEIMSFGLPIICFDLGAPAERIAEYKLGRVVPICDAAEFYQKILEFHEDLKRTSGEREAKLL
jgi:glycosyltransferase involved in cell wall biosynthesis